MRKQDFMRAIEIHMPVRERKYQKRPHRQAGRPVQGLGDVRGGTDGIE